ncbi:hypothetical protein [Rhabdaerophilum sp. SD176]|uniref:hypothetical protein n=1 Tax=Rhabdaerophilum sp. SD176 TaxID=2983548 RepID=UPI0024DF94FC|nr:hypothetical protein [Rhabdaerophilum sp. SD176]
MSVSGRLLFMLQTVADALGPDLRERLVFVGGCTTALFITDPVTLEDIRATDDVDLIVDLEGYAAWAELQAQLRAQGFQEAHDETVACRMSLNGLKVDFMPDDADILGFSNRWYAQGIASAETIQLRDGYPIKKLVPALFMATKLEAYLGRGQGDILMSHDLEDVLVVVDGRAELVDEIRGSSPEIRGFVARTVADLLTKPDFDDLLAGNIRGPEGRVELVRERLIAIAKA